MGFSWPPNPIYKMGTDGRLHFDMDADQEAMLKWAKRQAKDARRLSLILFVGGIVLLVTALMIGVAWISH